MWAKGARGGQRVSVVHGACPVRRRRIVHMSTAWQLVVEEGMRCLAVGIVLLEVGQCTVVGSAANRSAALRVKRARA